MATLLQEAITKCAVLKLVSNESSLVALFVGINLTEWPNWHFYSPELVCTFFLTWPSVRSKFFGLAVFPPVWERLLYTQNSDPHTHRHPFQIHPITGQSTHSEPLHFLWLFNNNNNNNNNTVYFLCTHSRIKQALGTYQIQWGVYREYTHNSIWFNNQRKCEAFTFHYFQP